MNKETLHTLHTSNDTTVFKAKDNVDMRTSTEMLPTVANDTGIVSICLILLERIDHFSAMSCYNLGW